MWLGLGLGGLGIKELSRLLSGSLLGWAYLSLELDPTTQTRSSSEAFLRDALQHTTNFVLYKSTLAKRAVFENGSANGVLVDSGGVLYNITVSQ